MLFCSESRSFGKKQQLSQEKFISFKFITDILIFYPNWICIFFQIPEECFHDILILLPIAFQEANFCKLPSPANDRNPFNCFFNKKLCILQLQLLFE